MGRNISLCDLVNLAGKSGSKIMYLGLPLSSPKGLSFLSKRKPQISTLGIGKLGYVDSEGILIVRSSSCRRVGVFREDVRGCKDKAHEISSSPLNRAAVSRLAKEWKKVACRVAAFSRGFPTLTERPRLFPNKDSAQSHRGHQQATLAASTFTGYNIM
jgi:hypothetical protein